MDEKDRLRDMSEVQRALQEAVNDIMRDNEKYIIHVNPVRNLAGHIERYNVVLQKSYTVGGSHYA